MKKLFLAVIIVCMSILSSCNVIHGTYVDTPEKGILWDDGTFDALPDGGDGDGNGND